MVAGKPMKLRMVPADDKEEERKNGELEKGDKNGELEKGDKNGECEKGDKNGEHEKCDNYASETSGSDIKLKPDLVVEETESEKDLAGNSKNELVEKGLEKIELMNTSTQEEEVIVSESVTQVLIILKIRVKSYSMCNKSYSQMVMALLLRKKKRSLIQMKALKQMQTNMMTVLDLQVNLTRKQI